MVSQFVEEFKEVGSEVEADYHLFFEDFELDKGLEMIYFQVKKFEKNYSKSMIKFLEEEST